jgi:hypothetical protein
VGVRGSAPRGGENEGGVRGLATWTGMTQTRWLRAAPTEAGGACLAGMGYEQGRTAACATRNSAADKWGQAMSGPGGSGRGAGGSVSERDSAPQSADRQARLHSAARFGLKPIQTDSKFFKL